MDIDTMLHITTIIPHPMEKTDSQGIALDAKDLQRCTVIKHEDSTMIAIDHNHSIELLDKYNAKLSRITHPNGILRVTNLNSGNVKTFNYSGIFGNGTLWTCTEDNNLKLVLK